MELLSSVEISVFGVPRTSAMDTRLHIVEHYICYFAVHRELAEAGIAVYGYDHHGHGLSEPKDPRDRALVGDFNYLVRSINLILLL